MNYLSRMSFVAAVMLFAAEGFAAPQQERTTPQNVQPDLQSLRPAPGEVLNAEEMFKILDLNGDGLIDRAEWRDRRMMIFFVTDENRDHALSRAEIPALSEEAFIAADDNGDRKLSGYEFNQAEFTTFEAADSSGDGLITFDEFSAYVSTLRGN
ncbi:MAG: EF-hand domain-containing protein [Hyphomicrobiales bacterium]|nr:EF-hand domain-containing protein [Hyphomicrobiales bacterium]